MDGAAGITGRGIPISAAGGGAEGGGAGGVAGGAGVESIFGEEIILVNSPGSELG